MKATEANFLDFLKKSPQFVIPIYQRTYSWTERECGQLWDDILKTGKNDNTRAHFTGSIVYIEEGLYQVSSQSSLLVIDGQQRLTTLMLILESLARHLGRDEPMDGFSARKLRNYYLLNPLEDGERGFKLLLTQTDKQCLLDIMQQKTELTNRSLRIEESFRLFDERIRTLDKSRLVHLCKGLAKLTIVDVALSRGQDNPQLIFESMNSTGRELSQADLIRNFILMGLEQGQQTRLYEEHWRPMETAFGQEAYGTHFDGYMRHYLTTRVGATPKLRAVYDAFKGYARSPEVERGGVDALVADIHRYAIHYCAMALDKEEDKDLAPVFRDLREYKVDVAFPLLLDLYEDYKCGHLSKGDLIQSVRFIEAYVFRRAVCSIPTNSLNKTFTRIGRALKKDPKDRYLQSIQAQLLTLQSYRRFPGDEEFKRELLVRDLYNFPRRSYWLRRLENHERKEPISVNEYTIEHIMPQNERLSAEWREALGPEWQQVQAKWLHTLGNLTLTGYNSEYSDHAFARKRDMEGGFKESPLRLNEGLGSLIVWNEEKIQRRAEQLATKAARVWASPALPADMLAELRAKPESPSVYGRSDHRHLAPTSLMWPVFEAFRKSALSLDSCVSEEFLKQYVAYKAETNFVDVVPQKSSLRLLLNLKFHELNDPKQLARDVSNVGRWGVGASEVKLKEVEELPYVMGLVRQAFEKQMEGGSIEH